jgi:DNA mismatch repair protein MutL
MDIQNKVKVLDKKTVNQIAAGEVIERPASVVKELVENSIDAGATQITIEIKDAGRKLIRVTDNGAGMTRSDAEVAFEKHSTSKIQRIEDLDYLTSLGFRGEALASIASVAKVECITKPHGIEIGTHVFIEGANTVKMKDIGCAVGTTIKVIDLFYNTPARLKFLKREQTELAHISDTVTRFVLRYKEIHFRLTHNGNELINSPVTENDIENIVNIYGKNVGRELVPIECNSEDGYIRIHGFISKPSITRGDVSNQSIFVNKRYVKNRLVSSTIKDVYRNLIPRHRYPVVILNLDINPSNIDVNIHPTKIQVRFEDEYRIRRLIYNAIETTLRQHNLITEIHAVDLKPQFKAIGTEATAMFTKPQSSLPIPSPIRPPVELEPQKVPPPPPRQSSLEIEEQKRSGEIGPESDNILKSQGSSTLPLMIPTGQIHNKYIIAQTGDGLVIIDQHAAAERIQFEKIRNKYETSSMQSQKLISPIQLELTPKEINALDSFIDKLKAMNFEIEPFGRNTYQVRAVPVVLGRVEDREAVHDIISDLLELGKVKDESILNEKIIQIMACRSAIKTGDPLNLTEMHSLIQELYSLKNPYSCAHGRPTIISLTDKQLEKWFHRT